MGFSLFEWIVVMLMAAILAAAVTLPFYQCPARWSGSGLSAEYGFFTGCMVKRKDGTVVPEKAIRDISL